MSDCKVNVLPVPSAMVDVFRAANEGRFQTPPARSAIVESLSACRAPKTADSAPDTMKVMPLAVVKLSAVMEPPSATVITTY